MQLVAVTAAERQRTGRIAAAIGERGRDDKGEMLPATERAVYLTSHLNLDLVGLNSGHPDNTDLQFSKDWTSSIHRVEAAELH